jgi:hypothetical protein
MNENQNQKQLQLLDKTASKHEAALTVSTVLFGSGPCIIRQRKSIQNGNQNERKAKTPERYRRGEVNTCLGSESCH